MSAGMIANKKPLDKLGDIRRFVPELAQVCHYMKVAEWTEVGKNVKQ